jgi:BMFP domain-containing protein YqiC
MQGSGEWVERKVNIGPNARGTEDQEPKEEEPKAEEPKAKDPFLTEEEKQHLIEDTRAFLRTKEGAEWGAMMRECFGIGRKKGEPKKQEPKLYEESSADEIIEASKDFAKEPSLAEYIYSVEIMKAEYRHRLDNIEAHIAKIEERLTEIEGVLSSIGSPDYDLREKVEDLEKRIETIFQNTRENHAEMFERVCGLEKRLRNY